MGHPTLTIPLEPRWEVLYPSQVGHLNLSIGPKYSESAKCFCFEVMVNKCRWALHHPEPPGG